MDNGELTIQDLEEILVRAMGLPDILSDHRRSENKRGRKLKPKIMGRLSEFGREELDISSPTIMYVKYDSVGFSRFVLEYKDLLNQGDYEEAKKLAFAWLREVRKEVINGRQYRIRV